MFHLSIVAFLLCFNHVHAEEVVKITRNYRHAKGQEMKFAPQKSGPWAINFITRWSKGKREISFKVPGSEALMEMWNSARPVLDKKVQSKKCRRPPHTLVHYKGKLSLFCMHDKRIDPLMKIWSYFQTLGQDAIKVRQKKRQLP